MNRVWMHHFGEALVPTPDDLGVQSGQASHPELLDYLAAKFMEFGWSIKQMHRVIMLSKAWRQIGVAVIRADRAPGVYGGRRTTVVVADFGVR